MSKIERDEQGRFKALPRTGRKKTCTKCGQYLYLGQFYKSSDKRSHPDGYDCQCKECRKQQKRDQYARTRKVPDGVRVNSEGIRVVHNGLSTRIHWTETQIREFQQRFPVTLNEDLAIDFGCSLRTIVRRAREMGLEKNKVWLDKIWEERRQMACRANRIAILHQDFTPLIEGGKPHRFTSENHPSRTATKEELSARAKRAWETRRHRKHKQPKVVPATPATPFSYRQ